MAPHEDLLANLAGAILDGTPIDWRSAQAEVDEAERPLLAHLRLLATLADVHRDVSRPSLAESSSVSVRSSEEEAEREHWGHLRVLERIGAGAFGDVYRAWDTRLDREVALKLTPAVRSDKGDSSSSIIEEGRLLARVCHPNVVTIHGAERIGDQIGFWMELVRGQTLQQILTQGTVFSAAEAVALGLELCHAVSAVHGAGLLHRDIKAQNVMRADDGRVVLMDFGAGRERHRNAGSDVVGTPLYLAPELLDGHPATVQSDVYSLGVLLYHLVTNSYPIQARALREVRQAHERGDRVPIRSIRPDLPSKVVRIIERATDAVPARRYQDTDLMAADLLELTKSQPLWRRAVLASAASLLVLIGWGSLSRPLWQTEPPVIAVLPFKNLSAEPDSEYFVDGLTDEIIRNLSEVDGLEVRSRNSSFAFKAEPRDTRQVSKQLNASFLVDGSVLRAEGNLRIQAQLVRAADDVPIWSGRFDREMKDIFAIQDEISRSIVNELRLKLGRGQRRYDTNLEAYELYLKGRSLVRRDMPDRWKAVALFEQVIGRDPAYAPAYAGLASAWADLSFNAMGIPPDEGYARMRPAAETAIQLDPLLAEAHAALGLVHSRDREWPRAESAFQRAIELNPNLALIRVYFVDSTLFPQGRLQEALKQLESAARADPLSTEVRRVQANVQISAGRYDAAIANVREMLVAQPDEYPPLPSLLARALLQTGQVTEAIALHEGVAQQERGEGNQGWLGYAYAIAGRRAEAERLADANVNFPARQAPIYGGLGEKDRAFDALERMAATKDPRVGAFLTYPELAVTRGDPRADALRKKLGFPH